MKGFDRLLVHLILLLLIPVWVYASGNCPYAPLKNEVLCRQLNSTLPNLGKVTYRLSHGIFEKIRKLNIQIPYSYNERMVRIQQLRKKTIIICEKIISER